MDSLLQIKNTIRDIPDFPKKGIIFKDITPVLKDEKLFSDTIKLMADIVSGQQIDVVTGIEARGFIFAAALAIELGCGFVPIRKPKKLPYKVFHQQYDLEYGTDSIEVHEDAFKNGQSVYLVDDLLATGGTAKAAADLIEKCGAKVAKVGFMIELSFLKGREKLEKYDVNSLISY